MNDDIRDCVATLWAFRAASERSAAARFCALGDTLQAAGAEPRILRRIRRAVKDESKHAKICASIGRAFGGAERPASPVREIRLGDAARTRPLYETVSISCVLETLNLRLMRMTLEHCAEPRIRAALLAILADETEHSAIGWDHLEYVAAREDVSFLSDLLPGMMALEARPHLFEPMAPDPDEAQLLALGNLPRRFVLDGFLRGLREDVFARLDAIGIATNAARSALDRAELSRHGDLERVT